MKNEQVEWVNIFVRFIDVGQLEFSDADNNKAVVPIEELRELGADVFWYPDNFFTAIYKYNMQCWSANSVEWKSLLAVYGVNQ